MVEPILKRQWGVLSPDRKLEKFEIYPRPPLNSDKNPRNYIHNSNIVIAGVHSITMHLTVNNPQLLTVVEIMPQSWVT